MYKPVTVLEWCVVYILLSCMWINSSVSLGEHVFSGWQHHSRCGSTDIWSCCPCNAHPQQHRQDHGNFAKPAPVQQSLWPLVYYFMKRWNSDQLNNNFHISFRKLLQYGCHDLLCQVWDGLSRMQSLCVHKNSTLASKQYTQPTDSTAAAKNAFPAVLFQPYFSTQEIAPYVRSWSQKLSGWWSTNVSTVISTILIVISIAQQTPSFQIRKCSGICRRRENIRLNL